MRICRLLFVLGFALQYSRAESGTVLVLQFQNDSAYQDLNWVGASIAETLQNELSAYGQIVLDREARTEGMRRLMIRPDVGLTKATLIRLAQTVGADYLCYGSYGISMPPNSSELKNSSVQITARYLDLHKMKEGPTALEAGPLSDLSRLEEHLAWQTLKYLRPTANIVLDQFLLPQKFIRLDAQESYTRGLLSSNTEHRQKWFTQAIALDPRLTSPAYELGRIALERKDYRQAINWFGRVPANSLHYADAQFKLGLSAFGAGDHGSALTYFRDLLKQYPLNEVYNNLAAAESELNMGTAVDDFRRALDGDVNDPVYQFNYGSALLRAGRFDEAGKYLQSVLDRDSGDKDAEALFQRATRREPVPANSKPIIRLKQSFDETTFRQLKAMLQPKGLTQ